MRSADLLKLCETLWNYIFPPRVDAAFLRTLIEPQRSQPKLGTHLSLTSNMWRGVDPSSRQGMRRKFVGSEIKWSWPFRVKHEGSKTQVFSNTCKETCQMYPNVFKCPDLLLSLSLSMFVQSLNEPIYLALLSTIMLRFLKEETALLPDVRRKVQN